MFPRPAPATIRWPGDCATAVGQIGLVDQLDPTFSRGHILNVGGRLATNGCKCGERNADRE